MALTKISRGLLNTGITDSSNATAITIDSSENVLIGTTTINSGTLGTSNTFLEVSAGTSSGSGTLILSRNTSTNNVELGGVRFVNANNADDDGLDADGKLVAAVSARSVTSDSNAGDDSGADLIFYTKPEAGNYAERGRFLSSGGLTFNGDTAAANALDDYEQGTWTPTLPNGGTINTNYSSRYTKIGNVVYWHTYMLLSFANDSNHFRVGLPFNTSSVSADSYPHGTVGYSGSVVTDDLRSHIQKGVNPAYVYFHETDGSAQAITNANMYARNYGDGRVTAFLLTGWYYTED